MRSEDGKKNKNKIHTEKSDRFLDPEFDLWK